MFRRALVPVAVLAAMLNSTMVVGEAAEPILKLALQPGDVPATAEILQSPTLIDDPDSLASLAPFGVHEEAQYGYSWPTNGASETSSDSIPKKWMVTGEVYRASDENGAKRLFALGKSAGGLGRSHLGKSLDLPPYGDEQYARVAKRSGLEMLLLVRKGTVVWEMVVISTLGHAALPDPALGQDLEAQLVAVLKTYAAKQKARVGSR